MRGTLAVQKQRTQRAQPHASQEEKKTAQHRRFIKEVDRQEATPDHQKGGQNQGWSNAKPTGIASIPQILAADRKPRLGKKKRTWGTARIGRRGHTKGPESAIMSYGKGRPFESGVNGVVL